MLAILLGVVAVAVIAGFVWTTCVAWEISRKTRTLAGLVYQASETTRAAIGPLDR